MNCLRNDLRLTWICAYSERIAVPTQRRAIPGSNAFVPAAAGLIIAGEVVRDLVSAGGKA